MAEILWQPDAARIAASRMASFAEAVGVPLVGKDHGYDALWRWSVQNRERFWSAIWDTCSVVGEKGATVLGEDVMPGADWFPEASLNFAENLLRLGEGRSIVQVGHIESEARDLHQIQ